jgi:hypothetical protein
MMMMAWNVRRVGINSNCKKETGIMQWCQSNFSSIEDIKTSRNRGYFRQQK